MEEEKKEKEQEQQEQEGEEEQLEDGQKFGDPKLNAVGY